MGKRFEEQGKGIKSCYYLNEDDLANYKLKLSDHDRVAKAYIWKAGDGEEGILSSLIDGRTRHESQEEAIEAWQKSIARMAGSTLVKEDWQVEYPIRLEVYSMKYPSMGVFQYMVFTQHHTYTGFTLIGLKTDSEEVIKDLAGLIANKMAACD